MDISLPKLSGIEAARQIRKVAPNCKILFLSTYDSLEIVEAALDSAASGYVLKVDAGKELAKAVKAVFQGKRYVSGRLKKVTPADTGDTHAPDREVLGSPSVPGPTKKNGICKVGSGANRHGQRDTSIPRIARILRRSITSRGDLPGFSSHRSKSAI
jgi:hypothetical protein